MTMERVETPEGRCGKQSYCILRGNASEIVKTLPLIHTVVTSPAYFQKRKYGDSRNEMGNETSVEEYVQALVSVFGAIPLHPRGSIWVNLGDTRNPKGDLRMVPEQFALSMQNSRWHMIDNVI